jgi:hypothetical protein
VAFSLKATLTKDNIHVLYVRDSSFGPGSL